MDQMIFTLFFFQLIQEIFFHSGHQWSSQIFHCCWRQTSSGLDETENHLEYVRLNVLNFKTILVKFSTVAWVNIAANTGLLAAKMFLWTSNFKKLRTLKTTSLEINFGNFAFRPVRYRYCDYWGKSVQFYHLILGYYVFPESASLLA